MDLEHRLETHERVGNTCQSWCLAADQLFAAARVVKTQYDTFDVDAWATSAAETKAQGLVDQMDRNAVREWVAKDPATRAALLSQIVAWNLADTSLAAELLDSYGHIEEVGQAFHSRRMSGAWVGAASERWATLAREMEDVVRSTKRGGLRKWAAAMAADLRERADRDRMREAERDLRERD